jgi:hypothetical protein
VHRLEQLFGEPLLRAVGVGLLAKRLGLGEEVIERVAALAPYTDALLK